MSPQVDIMLETNMRGLAVLGLMLALSGAAVGADFVAPAANADGRTQANTINPYELLDLTQAQLAQRFPKLPRVELDKLVFEIADINSMQSVQTK